MDALDVFWGLKKTAGSRTVGMLWELHEHCHVSNLTWPRNCHVILYLLIILKFKIFNI